MSLSLAALVLLSDMPTHGISSTEDCTATGVCAWRMIVHLQSVLSQFFASTQYCIAVFDYAAKLHDRKGYRGFGLFQEAPHNERTTVFASLSAVSLAASQS